ncbi:MAG: flagellar protein export ATPase FliI [Dethiobacter sp.]|jgi:flagellum-specific ATP synthase/type III secretion protein N (ATPase)|nr:MAG: flagellar protein export ATPase FliI [Dethiobacter sp.]
MQPKCRQIDFFRYHSVLAETSTLKLTGRVSQVVGLTIEIKGLKAALGEICRIYVHGSSPLPAEVVGFRNNTVIAMPLGELTGISPGSRVASSGETFSVAVGSELLGRVLDGLGRPLLKDSFLPAMEKRPVESPPLNPLERCRIDEILSTGVKCIDSLLTCGEGQRVGIFSGSGVGKSTLLGMIARHSGADVNVIGLIGERGREVGGFLERDLGKEGLKRSVVVVATSDQPALIRIKGALVATTIAEYFREQGLKVLLMMDSVTRLAMAQREVGLAIGEPPTTKGYTPSVFAMLPKLLERAGKLRKGSITGFYTVLVEGDDFNEPIADTVRSILDGHLVLRRSLAAKNHFPAIDVLESSSRLMLDVTPREQQELSGRLKNLLATYREAEDLINIGAYVEGSDAKIDEARKYHDTINSFLCQKIDEHVPYTESVSLLREVFEK